MSYIPIKLFETSSLSKRITLAKGKFKVPNLFYVDRFMVAGGSWNGLEWEIYASANKRPCVRHPRATQQGEKNYLSPGTLNLNHKA